MTINIIEEKEIQQKKNKRHKHIGIVESKKQKRRD
jgi:hypothetical protein